VIKRIWGEKKVATTCKQWYCRKISSKTIWKRTRSQHCTSTPMISPKNHDEKERKSTYKGIGWETYQEKTSIKSERSLKDVTIDEMDPNEHKWANKAQLVNWCSIILIQMLVELSH
jgi:hypothetical protein